MFFGRGNSNSKQIQEFRDITNTSYGIFFSLQKNKHTDF